MIIDFYQVLQDCSRVYGNKITLRSYFWNDKNYRIEIINCDGKRRRVIKLKKNTTDPRAIDVLAIET